MRKHNNSKTRSVIISLLLLGQIAPLYADEPVGEKPNSGSVASSPEQTSEKETVITPVVTNPLEVQQPDTKKQDAKQSDSGQPETAENSAASAQRKPEVANEKSVNHFDILEFRVEGNTKLSKGQVEAAVYPQMGENKTIDDVEKAREALEKAYHQAGYLTVLVDIPEQDVDKKIVRLNVTEGKVGRLRIKDSHYFTLGRIKALAPSVKEGEVPHFPTVQQDIAKLNRTADKRVTPVLKAGKVFGTVDVDLKVEDNFPFHASLELNNYNSRDTTPLRLGGMIRYDNLWQLEHSLSLNFLLSPQDVSEVRVLSANYLMRFDETDLMLAIYGVRSNSSVASVGGISILGNGSILGVRLIKPLPALDKFFHSVSVGLDYKSFGQTVEFGGKFETPVSYLPLSASYNATWQGASGTTQLNAGVTLSMRGVVGDELEFEAKRSGSKPNFFVAKADLQRTQNLPWGFQGFAKLGGVFSGQPLISNEQYLAGGADSVRGYLEAEAAGDQAIYTSLELRTPALLSSLDWLQGFRFSTFLDVAQIRTLNPLAGQAANSTLAGTGFGLNFKAWKNFNANINLAWALTDSEVTRQGDFRSHIRLWYEF